MCLLFPMLHTYILHRVNTVKKCKTGRCLVLGGRLSITSATIIHPSSPISHYLQYNSNSQYQVVMEVSPLPFRPHTFAPAISLLVQFGPQSTTSYHSIFGAKFVFQTKYHAVILYCPNRYDSPAIKFERTLQKLIEGKQFSPISSNCHQTKHNIEGRQS